MIAAAVLPGTGRRMRFRLGDDPCEHGFPVLLDGVVVGHSRHFREELVAAMTVAGRVEKVAAERLATR